MKPITIFTGATGLNTVMDPVRIPAQKSELSDLQVAVNVTIDQSFRTSRRAGVVLKNPKQKPIIKRSARFF